MNSVILQEENWWGYIVVIAFVGLAMALIYYAVQPLKVFNTRDTAKVALGWVPSRFRGLWIIMVLFRITLAAGSCWIASLIVNESLLTFNSIHRVDDRVVFNYRAPVADENLSISNVVSAVIADEGTETGILVVETTSGKHLRSVRTFKQDLMDAVELLDKQSDYK